MCRRISTSLVAVALLAMTGCAAARYETITYPPRIDLTKHELIGVIEFSSPDEKGLAAVVTTRFTELARRDQGMVRMLALHAEGARPGPERVRELARANGLSSILVGELRISKVRPSVSLSETLSSGSVSASIEATLSVEMIEAATGASLWNASARSRGNLGNVHISGAKNVGFDAVGRESAYGALVDALVEQVTRDLQSSWERRRVG